MKKSCLFLSSILLCCSYAMTAQVTDSTSQQSGFNRLSENTSSDEELDLQIQNLLAEINAIDNEAMTHDMSVEHSHQIMNQGQVMTLHTELERLKVRQDFYQHHTDYILPIDHLNITLLPQIKSSLLQSLETFKQERFLAIVLAKSLFNILFIQKDFKSYIHLYEKYIHLFSLDDKDIMIQLTQAYAEENSKKKSLEVSENLYLAQSDDADIFLNHMHNLVHHKEFAELEFYLKDLLVFNDVKSLIALANHYYSQEKIADASALVTFIEPLIEKNLQEEFQWDLTQFNWNYNKDRIIIKTEGGAFGHTQTHHAADLYTLAQYIDILDPTTSCRFQKYAYISSYADIKEMFDSEVNIYMEPALQDIYKKELIKKRDAVLNLQKEILKNRCL